MDETAFAQSIRLLRRVVDACPRSSMIWKMFEDPNYRQSEWDTAPQEVRQMVQLLSEAKAFLDTWEPKI